jgi:preprotein translocase subunit YajC
MQLSDLIPSFLMPSANAAVGVPTAAQAQQQGSGISFFLMMALLLAFMFFAVWRPQSRRAAEQRNLLTSLAAGDDVMTAGGIIGTIIKINDNYVVLALSDTVHVTMQKSSIVSALPKGTLKSI